MIIYLEGVDGSGKTTLADALYKRLIELAPIKKVEIVRDGQSLIDTKAGSSTRLTKAELVPKLKEMIGCQKTIYICDRGPLSDIIYRTFDDYEPVLSFRDFWVIWSLMLTKMTVIHCSTKHSEKLMRERGDDNPIALQRHNELKYLYNELMPFFEPLTYDLTDQGTEEQLPHFVNFVLANVWRGLDLAKTFNEKMIKTHTKIISDAFIKIQNNGEK